MAIWDQSRTLVRDFDHGHFKEASEGVLTGDWPSVRRRVNFSASLGRAMLSVNGLNNVHVSWNSD